MNPMNSNPSGQTVSTTTTQKTVTVTPMSSSTGSSIPTNPGGPNMPLPTNPGGPNIPSSGYGSGMPPSSGMSGLQSSGGSGYGMSDGNYGMGGGLQSSGMGGSNYRTNPTPSGMSGSQQGGSGYGMSGGNYGIGGAPTSSGTSGSQMGGSNNYGTTSSCPACPTVGQQGTCMPSSVVQPGGPNIPSTDERPIALAAEIREEQFLAKEEKLNDRLALREEKTASKFEKKAEREHNMIEKLAQKGKTQALVSHEAREAEYLAAAQVHHKAACDAQLHANSAQSLLSTDPNNPNNKTFGGQTGMVTSSQTTTTLPPKN